MLGDYSAQFIIAHMYGVRSQYRNYSWHITNTNKNSNIYSLRSEMHDGFLLRTPQQDEQGSRCNSQR